MKKRIYLDNNASTAVDPRVVETMIETLRSSGGNPSSLHSFGQEARGQLTKSRQIIASFLEIKPSELIFTSSGTEALNMVIKGLLKRSHGHVISSVAEHAAVYTTLKQIENEGIPITFLPTGLTGSVSPQSVKEAIRSDTRLIVLMAVNNETGVKTDLKTIAAIAEQAGIPFLVDGVALLGKELFTIPKGVSAICFSGHKLHAAKGVGFAFVRSNFKILPLVSGGEQEFGRRGGTENLPGIVGLAEAVRLLTQELPTASIRMKNLRDQLQGELLKRIPKSIVNGTGERVCNTLNIAFPGVDGETLLTTLDLEGVAVSHGSACSSGALEPSRILLNMGVPLSLARSSIRISLSRFTTEEEILQAASVIERAVLKLQKN